MKLAKVVRVHPGRRKVDLVCLDSGRRMPGVKVMAVDASSSSGASGLPVPDSQSLPDPYDAPMHSDRDIIACVAFYGHIPVVQGFLFPEVSECLFPDLDRYMHRTPSDFYWTVDGKGNAELRHPSGAYVRIAETPEHEDLTGKDFDKVWNPKRNAGRQVHFHIEQAGGVAKLNIAPDGTTTYETVSSITATAGGAVTVNAPTVTVNADTVTSNAPLTHCTGELKVDGLITGAAGMAVAAPGGGGPAIAAAGSMQVTGGDIVADDISLKGHGHMEQGDGARVGNAIP